MSLLFGHIRGLFVLLLVICLIVLIVVPVPVKYLARRLARVTVYIPTEEAKVETGVNYTLYRETDAPKRSSVIAIVVGGAFMFSDLDTHYGLANEIWRECRERHDVLVVSYPVRFGNTLHDAMLSLNDTFQRVVRDDYAKRHLVGVSSGALLAGTFLRKEKDATYSRLIDVPRIGLSFDSFVGLNGVYDTTFDSGLVSTLFRFYVLRGTKHGEQYSAYGVGAKTLVIASTNDFLYAQQTERYLRTNECDKLLFGNQTNLPHNFMQMMQYPESDTVVKKISEFVDEPRLAL